ncbi:hypothetical protein EON63_18675 [archaeon]|nr:MAG: hypothetical protein EON63_18675 [archaeon]
MHTRMYSYTYIQQHTQTRHIPYTQSILIIVEFPCPCTHVIHINMRCVYIVVACMRMCACVNTLHSHHISYQRGSHGVRRSDLKTRHKHVAD